MIEDEKTKGQRTLRQNAALHLFFSQLSDSLNDSGMDMKAFLKDEIEIPWTKENVKNHIWKPVQDLFLNKESTTKLDTDQVQKVYDVLRRHFIEKHPGIDFPQFPNEAWGVNYE